MKNFLITVLAIICLISLGSYCMDKQERLYSKIEQLAPEAPQKSYLSMIYKLYKNKMSVCSCMQGQLAKQRAYAVEKIEENEQLTKGTFLALKRLFESNPVENPTITIDPILKSTIDTQILKETVAHADLKKDIICKAQKPFWRFWYSIDPDFLAGVEQNSADTAIMRVGKGLSNYSATAQQGIWLHELQHIKNNDGSLDYLARDETSLFPVLQCAEREADRIPAACGSAYDAQCMMTLFEEMVSQEQKSEKSFKKTAQHIPRAWKKEQNDPHPSRIDRLAWAKRIYKLKKAEQLFNNNLAQFKALKNNKIRFNAMNQFE